MKKKHNYGIPAKCLLLIHFNPERNVLYQQRQTSPSPFIPLYTGSVQILNAGFKTFPILFYKPLFHILPLEFFVVSHRGPQNIKNMVCKYLHWFQRYLSLKNE